MNAIGLIGEAYDLIKDLYVLAEKHRDQEISGKLVDLQGKIMELQAENESLKKRINELEVRKDIEEDLEIDSNGWCVRKSEASAGKNIPYCVACFQNTGKLFPIVHGSLHRDYFCINCKVHYNGKSG